MDTTVDVTVRVGEETLEYKQLPSNLSIANSDQSQVVVSDSRESMTAEVEAMLRTSKGILESIPYHNSVIANCDSILRELNPQFAKEKEQEEKIGLLEQKMGNIETHLAQLTGLLSKQLTHSGNTSKPSNNYEDNRDNRD
jgi:ribosome-associated translation inhibitor RaiA